MTDHGLTPIGGVNPTARPSIARRPTAPASDGSAAAPPALQAEYQAAARVIEELAAQQVNLHFEIHEPTNSVRVQVLGPEGQVIREIPARSLLEMLSGGGLLVDERG